MKYVEVAGLKISKVGIGAWQWGAKCWGYGKSYSKEELYRAFRKALDLGINFIDTAEIYGDSEEIIGEFMEKEGREGLVIATKVWPLHATYEGTLKAAERSLKRLRAKYIDIYQIHWPNPLINLKETIMALDKLYIDGKIMAAGLSNFGLKGLKRARELAEAVPIISNQVKYNLLERGPERELLPYIQKEGLLLIAYSPLAQGILAGSTERNNWVRMVNPLFSRFNLRRIKPLLELLGEYSKQYGVPMASIAIAWLARKDRVVPIPGVKNEEHVEEVAIAQDIDLPEGAWRAMEEVVSKIKISRLLGLFPL